MRQIVCSNCMSRVEIGARQCPYCGQSFANTNPAGALPVNTLLAGRYTMGKVIGVDGEGIEYAAIDGELERRVVVKEYIPFTICAARAADGRVLPRQGREVLYKTTRMDFVEMYRALVSMGRTPGLVTVLDLVEANDTAYAVREPDEGMTMTQYLDELRIPLTNEEALTLLTPIVNGVEAMHRAGLLHRGICPENVRVTDEGAKLSGYATLGLRTANSDLKSKLSEGFAAPEQYSVAEFQGTYTDVYSLGALFYFAVTGRTPLAANLRRVQDTMPAAHAILKQIPGYFSAGIASAMRVAPNERIQSAASLLAALTAPVPGAAGGSIFAGLTKRHWQIIGACGAGFLVVMALLIWFIVGMLPGGEEATSSVSLPQSASAPASSASQAASAAEVVLVPEFKGQRYDDIIAQPAYRDNFRFKVVYEHSSTVAEGVVISQDYLVNMEVPVGTTIELTVSEGPNLVAMPAVASHTRESVENQLSLLGIKYELEWQANDGSYAEDQVIGSDFAEGQMVDIDNDVVRIFVAEAPAPPTSSSTATPPATSSSTPPASSDQTPASEPTDNQTPGGGMTEG